MNAMNAGTSVQKEMGPEEHAILENIESLIQELETGSNAAPEDEGQEAGMQPGAAKAANPVMQPVTKAEEQTRQEGADAVTQPGAAPKDAGMAPWDKDDVKKAFATIAKSIQASDTEGVTANDPGDKRAEEIPTVDEENVKEVAKALLSMIGGKKTVAKSVDNGVNGEMMKVMKAMSDKINQQGAIIGEILEGIGAANGMTIQPAVSSQVQKSQGNTPIAQMGGQDMVQVIASSVAKAMADSGAYQRRDSGIPMAVGFSNNDVQKSQDLRDFTEGFVENSKDKWGNTVQQ